MPSSEPVAGDGLVVRPATSDDADALAALFLAAREAAHPAIPLPVHPPDDVRRWWRTRFETDGCEVWLAEDPTDAAGPSGPVGLLLLEEDWVHSLYVAPGRTGEGIGSVLLDVAKSRRPRRLGLWVFESNQGAQRFYRRHGFVELRRTDGADNEERAADIEMAWPDPASLAGLRGRIDDLDDRLAVLLARRAETTARVQRVKQVPGHAGRDAAREDEIVRRMARLAPELGEERLRRIMAVVITESLDAASTDPPPEGDR
jgi:chorismate mutase/GNAT superfamily N-acetyltransferase